MAEHASSGDTSLDRRFQWGQGSLEAGDAETAAELFASVTEGAPGWPAGWYHLGLARKKLGHGEPAAEALARYLALDPADRLGAGVLLVALGAGDRQNAMSAAYVTALFDDYAPRFDAHLTEKLRYSGPQALMAALEKLGLPFRFARALDLGCGTGLMARALEGAAETLIGVDLSQRMLDEARKIGLYAELHQGDVVAFLDDQPQPADLILAADVLVYIGDLDPLLGAAARKLSPGGLFAFTVQGRAGEGFALGEDARYAHSEAYLRATASAAGLRIALLEPVSTRMDRGVPVPGLVLVLEPA